MGRSFYVIYVHKTTTRATTIIAWTSLAFMISFWTWYFVSDGLWPEEMGKARFVPDLEPAATRE